jgi:predicted nucleotidyltransferase
MAIGPRNPKEIFPEILSDYKGVFGADLVSIILYGSAAGKDYRPGRSDINFMIVLTGEGIERLDRAFDMVKRWRKRNVAIPLFLTEGYIKTSLDVFPVEYLSFKRNYVLIYGKDVLEGLTFDMELMRLQCEREIKGKLLLLRQAFLETSGRGKALKELVANSIPALIAIFEALLYIKGKEIPRERREIVRSVAEAFGVDRSVFESLVEIKAEEVKLTDREIREFFKGYLREMRRLSGLVDALGGGDE